MGNNADSFAWPPLAIDMLRKYWADGASAGYIAGRLNAVFKAGLSRNAVIGKIGRLGLQRDEDEVRAARRESGRASGRLMSARSRERRKGIIEKAVAKCAAEPAAAAPAKPAWTPNDLTPVAPPPPPPRIPTVHVSAITGGIIPGPHPSPPRLLPLPTPAPVSGQPLTIDQLTHASCRWPIDPDGEHGWRYCGKRRDPKSRLSCYCTEHFSRSVGRARRAA
jgi:hypothetical protein